MIGTKASAVSGPTPGCVISHNTSGRFLASWATVAVNFSMVESNPSSSSNKSCRRRVAHGANSKNRPKAKPNLEAQEQNGNNNPYRQRTRPGRCPELELIALRTLMINRARQRFCQGRFPASLIYVLIVSPWPAVPSTLMPLPSRSFGEPVLFSPGDSVILSLFPEGKEESCKRQRVTFCAVAASLFDYRDGRCGEHSFSS